jgi:hypothetical protein
MNLESRDMLLAKDTSSIPRSTDFIKAKKELHQWISYDFIMQLLVLSLMLMNFILTVKMMKPIISCEEEEDTMMRFGEA